MMAGEFSTYYHKVNDSTSLGENSIKDITEDNDGAIWLAIGASGVSRMEPTTKKFTNFKPNKQGTSVLSDNVKCIATDHLNNVWIGLDDGLSVYDNYRKKFSNARTLSGSRDTLSVNCLYVDRSSGVWVGASSGLYVSRGGLSSLVKVKTNIILKM